ncbi:MAG: DUF4040 domain-containing protein [Labilithrix sp.]|nr:DUF4040 domain-containing protein [Labilithrix sp.]
METDVTADGLFDGVLAAGLTVLGAWVVLARSLRVAVTLFIAFGMLSAMAWTRLDAVDVALVEAALGTGLTGALLLSSLPWAEPAAAKLAPAGSALARAALGLALLTGALLGGWSARSSMTEGLTALVMSTMDRTGVDHPVTAVLLDFRGYDTLLEVTVLLVAAVAVRAIQPRGPRAETVLVPDVLASFVTLLVPASILVAGYLLWRGADGPGGAFQAAAILAGSALVLVLSGRVRAPGATLAARVALLAGPLLFVVIAAAALAGGAHMLEYPRASSGAVMVGLETALAISIALILLSFFPPPRVRARGSA